MGSRQGRPSGGVVQRRRGATVSDKQLAHTVRDGRAIRLVTATDSIQGYLAGMDDFHWMVVTPDVEVVLIHKTAAERVYLSEDRFLDTEAEAAAISKIVNPFRNWVMTEFFGGSG